MNEKASRRRLALAARRSLTEAERDELSLSIAYHVAASRQWHRAQYIASYLPAADEVNSWPLTERAWRMRKRIYVPVLGRGSHMRFAELSRTSRLVRNRYGLLEPDCGTQIETRRLDLVLTPLVAFDDRGNRIGMGGGYYDRAFAFLNHRDRYRRPKLIGLAFTCQRTDDLSASRWDIPLFQVYTEFGPALAASP
jgi:5-formyltetrahydrofolate cyclo-ligase